METFKKKDWQDFMDGKIAVNCPSQALANEFGSSDRVTQFTQNGWENMYWDSYKTDTCYTLFDPNTMLYCDVDYYVKQENKIIKEFKGWNEFEGIEGVEEREEREVKPKPPLGVMPKYIFEEKRIQDLCRALYEYAEYKIDKQTAESMREWSIELEERLFEIINDIKRKEAISELMQDIND